MLSLEKMKNWLRGRSYTSNFHKKDEFIDTLSTSLPVSEITGNPGGGQESATEIQAGINVVDIASFGDSVKLSNDIALGYPIVIHNDTDIDGVSIFPSVGGTINGGSVNAEYNLGPRQTAQAYKIADDTFIVTNVAEV